MVTSVQEHEVVLEEMRAEVESWPRQYDLPSSLPTFQGRVENLLQLVTRKKKILEQQKSGKEAAMESACPFSFKSDAVAGQEKEARAKQTREQLKSDEQAHELAEQMAVEVDGVRQKAADEKVLRRVDSLRQELAALEAALGGLLDVEDSLSDRVTALRGVLADAEAFRAEKLRELTQDPHAQAASGSGLYYYFFRKILDDYYAETSW